MNGLRVPVLCGGRLPAMPDALPRHAGPVTVGAMLRSGGIDPDALVSIAPRVDPDTVTVRVASPLFRRMWARGISAVTMPWAIYVTPGVMDRHLAGAEPRRTGRLMAHELMHVEQWRRLGGLRHLIQYVGDYLRGRVRGLTHWQAYRAVRLEQEARAAARLITEDGPR